MPSVFAWKVLGTLKLHNNYSYYNPEIVQAACKKFEADISDLKKRLKTQETETRKANAKFESSIAAQETLKKKFEKNPIKIFGCHKISSPAMSIRCTAAGTWRLTW